MRSYGCEEALDLVEIEGKKKPRGSSPANGRGLLEDYGLSITSLEINMQLTPNFVRLLSEARLAGYTTEYAKTKSNDPLAMYMWNMHLSESLYPLLQTVEVALRNAINESVAERYKDQAWLLGVQVLDTSDVIIVQKRKEKLALHLKNPPVGKIIADLNFGFWTGLLETKYELKLWRTKIIYLAFPYLDQAHRTRKNISRVFYKIKHLRNRVFHHEPIWHWQDLMIQHDLILEAISWMDPQILSLVEPDRFKTIYLAGPDKYK